MQDPEIPRDLDHEALDAYLAFRYVPSPHERVHGGAQAAAGPHARVRGGRAARSSATGSWITRASGSFGRRGRAARGDPRGQSGAATRQRMVADVPLGRVPVGRRRLRRGRGRDGRGLRRSPSRRSRSASRLERLDELPLARLVAEHFGTEHHELVVEPRAIEILPTIVRHYGEPFADAIGDPELLPGRDGPRARHGGAQRRRRRRGVRRLPALRRATRRWPDGPCARAGCGMRPPRSPAGCPAARERRLAGPAGSAGSAGTACGWTVPTRYIAYMTDLHGLHRSRLYTPEYAELVGPGRVDATIRGPWERSSAARRRRPDARRGHADLPARRPAHQGRHRDDGRARWRVARRCSTTS